MNNNATETETPVRDVDGWQWLDTSDLLADGEPCMN